MKQLAIMKNVKFGCRDMGTPCLFFDTYISENVAALQVIVGQDALRVIESAGVYDVHDLEGNPCWVNTDGIELRFLEIAKI